MSMSKICPPRPFAGAWFALMLCGAFHASAHAASNVLATKIAAAQQATASDAACKALGDFYWEVGDAQGPLGSGRIGTEYSANGKLKIASASKWVWGAYVLEKIGRDAQPTPEQVDYLEMKSGYTRLNPLLCSLSRSVQACLSIRNNGQRDSSAIGRFFYNGGHDQAMAVSMGLGSYNAAQLSAKVTHTLGGDLKFGYASPQPAGGMESSPTEYGKFLRRILSGQLRMRDFLGYQPACTQCSEAQDSPVKVAWHYSLNHWIEDAPGDDGAYSSPGLMGFYPWIAADKSSYGIVARKTLRANAAWESAQCGARIRKAWAEAR